MAASQASCLANSSLGSRAGISCIGLEHWHPLIKEDLNNLAAAQAAGGNMPGRASRFGHDLRGMLALAEGINEAGAGGSHGV